MQNNKCMEMARVNVVPAVGVEQHVKPMGGTTHTMSIMYCN